MSITTSIVVAYPALLQKKAIYDEQLERVDLYLDNSGATALRFVIWASSPNKDWSKDNFVSLIRTLEESKGLK